MRKQLNLTWTLIGLIVVSSACGSEAPVSLSATRTDIYTCSYITVN